ncbi:hypothetical protein BGX38DRAFT_1232067 [Terfezia claveryi]|nr:hypothetical protein BGX38DRAFT_1232067 [Terfezia claveryi]
MAMTMSLTKTIGIARIARMAADHRKNTAVAEMVKGKAVITIDERVAGSLVSTTTNRAEVILPQDLVHLTRATVVLSQINKQALNTVYHKSRFQFIHEEDPLGHIWPTLTSQGSGHYVTPCVLSLQNLSVIQKLLKKRWSHYLKQGDGGALDSMMTELEAALSQVGGIDTEALEALFNNFANRLRGDFKGPPYSPASYSGLIRLALELQDIQLWLLSKEVLEELGWDLLGRVLNRNIWQPTFYKFFPTKYAGINLEGYKSVQTFPVPYTQYWTPNKWNCLRMDLTCTTTSRLKFKNDYRSVIAFINGEYGNTFLPILSRFFTEDRAFFTNLDKFKKHTIKRLKGKVSVPSYYDLVKHLKESKSGYLVTWNQPEGGDEMTLDLVGLVAFAYSLIDIERVTQEAMAEITDNKTHLAETDINMRPPADVMMAISDILWQPAREHVERYVERLDDYRSEANVLAKLNDLKLETNSKKLIEDTPEGMARAAALTIEQEVARDKAEAEVKAQTEQKRVQKFEEGLQKRNSVYDWSRKVNG